MADPTPKSFIEMLDLISQHQRRPNDPFSPELLMAIFWEESLFTNIRQKGGGTAIGFGQVEPAEMGKITTDRAKELGYYVAGVSSSTKGLDDALSVTVPSCYLLHLYHASGAPTVEARVDFALKAYAGYWYEGPSPLTKEQRLAIIGGWRRCESMLSELPFTPASARGEASTQMEDAYMAALRHARPFSAEALRPRLFPPGWSATVPAVDGEAPGTTSLVLAPAAILALLGGGLAAWEVARPGTLRMLLAAAGRLAARIASRVKRIRR